MVFYKMLNVRLKRGKFNILRNTINWVCRGDTDELRRSNYLEEVELSGTDCIDRQNNCILWTIAAIVSSMVNGKFLLWQNEYYFA